MDSRSIHKATARLAHLIKWEQASGAEWLHSGVGSEFNEFMVQEHINRFFSQKRILIVLNRRNTLDISTNEAAHSLHELLSEDTIALWDHSLTQTMQFNRIGVFRCGKVSA